VSSSADRFSSRSLAVGLACTLWAAAFVRSSQFSWRPNDPPYGVLWSCRIVSKPGSPTRKSLELAGIVRDPEDFLFPQQLFVTRNGSVLTWLNLYETPLEVHWDPSSGTLYRKWSLRLPVENRHGGIDTYVVSAQDTHGAIGEMGRCQLDSSAQP